MLAAIASKGADGRPDLGAALGAGDLKTLSEAIVAACDPSDGMVNNIKACRFSPAPCASKHRAGFLLNKFRSKRPSVFLRDDFHLGPVLRHRSFRGWRLIVGLRVPVPVECKADKSQYYEEAPATIIQCGYSIAASIRQHSLALVPIIHPLPSCVSLQLPLAPTMIVAIRTKHPLDVGPRKSAARRPRGRKADVSLGL
jgi:hypothetical protein